MKRRDVIGVQPPTQERMAWLDRQVIDPQSIEQVAHVAELLHVNMNRVLASIEAEAKTGGAIRKGLAASPFIVRWRTDSRDYFT